MSEVSKVTSGLGSLKFSRKKASTKDELKAEREAKAKVRKENQEKWALAALKIPTELPSDLTVATGNAICSNFFKITCIAPKIGTKTLDLHRYTINLDLVNNKEPKKKELRRYLITTLLQQLPQGSVYACDYFSHIVSIGTLWEHDSAIVPDLNDPSNTLSIQHHRTPRPNEAAPAAMTSNIKYAGIVRMKELLDHVKRRNRVKIDFPAEEHFRALNIITWKHINSNDFRGGRVGNKFYPDHESLSMPLNRWVNRNLIQVYVARTGFFTSVRPGDGLLLLNVNTATTAFYPTWRLDFWIKRRWGNNCIIPPTSPNGRKGEPIGLKVTFEGDDPNMGKIRTISEISDKLFKDQDFLKVKNDQKSKVNCLRHHITQYGPRTPRNLNFTEEDNNGNTACVNLGGTTEGQQRWYPANKLHIVDWQNFEGKVPSDYTSDMLAAAKKSPIENQQRIREFALGPLGILCPKQPNLPRPFLGDFGLEIGSSFTGLRERRHNQPKILYKGNVQAGLTSANYKSSWNLEKVAKRLEKFDKDPKHPHGDQKGNPQGRGLFLVRDEYPRLYAIVLTGTAKPDDVEWLKRFARDRFQDQLQRYGFLTNGSRVINAVCQPGRNFVVPALNNAYRTLCSPDQEGGEAAQPPLILIQLPGDKKNDTYYSDVKWWGDCVVGVPTVCITNSSIVKFRDSRVQEKQRDSLLANISLKFNFKLRGTNHRIEGNLSIIKPGTLLVGADVTHSGRGHDLGCPSLAGIVASFGDFPGAKIPYSGDFHKYLASARLQSNNTEFIEYLDEMMFERIHTYWFASKYRDGTDKNTKEPLSTALPPDHILFYRDGVSESQYGMVYDAELPLIRKVIEKVKAIPAVAKNFPKWDPKITLLIVGKRHHARFYHNPGSKFNVSAGLVIDHTIVAPTPLNFYLQSHDSPIGTSRNGHYVVIINESKYTVAQLEDITNKLCFTGSRATTANSICTPARYADILCDRLRCYMKPVLDGTFVNNGTLNQGELGDYQRNSYIWKQRGGNTTSVGPWHPNMDKIMFYL